MSNADRVSAYRGVNLILRRDGSEVHLDDIATAEEGQAILDEIDAAILAIENQVETSCGRDHDWRRRAGVALKRKRRVRPALQQRIAVLRKAEKKPPIVKATAQRDIGDRRRQAFIKAADATLDPELYLEIWQRASEFDPQAFDLLPFSASTRVSAGS